MNKKSGKRIIFYLLIAVFIAFIVFNTVNPFGAKSYDTVGDLIDDIKAERVVKFTVNENGKCEVEVKVLNKDGTFAVGDDGLRADELAVSFAARIVGKREGHVFAV